MKDNHVAVMKTVDKLNRVKGELKKVVKGRDELIDGLILAISSNQHILIMGKHGEAKSMVVNVLKQITDLPTYYTQIHNETIVKDIVGILNPIDYQKGKISLIRTPFWDSHILFFDEFLRGRSEFLDFLLEVMVERKCSKTLLGEIKLPILSIIATSNPLTEDYNTERLDLALKDRFFVIISIDHLIETEQKSKIRDILESKIDVNDIFNNGNKADVKKVTVSYEELKTLPKYAKENIEVDIENILMIFDKCKDLGFLFSTRFIKNFKDTLQTYLLISNKTKAEHKDYFYLANLMMSNRYDGLNSDKITDIVDEVLTCSQYSSMIKDIDNLMENKDKVTDFIQKGIKILNDVNQDFSNMPKRIQDKITSLRNELELRIRTNLNVMSPKLMKMLDDEQFKPIIESYIKRFTITTKQIKPTEKTILTKLNSLLKKEAKSCIVEKKTTDVGNIQFKIIPRIDKPISFKEIETTKKYLSDLGYFGYY